MRVLRVLVSSFLAGIMIAIGGSVFLSLVSINKVAGALLFSVGLFSILMFRLHLYTGKICYVVSGDGKWQNRVIEVLATLVGNTLGAGMTGLLLSEKFMTVAEPLVKGKLEISLGYVFVYALFCGILIYVAVEAFRSVKEGALKSTIVFLCVSVFILSGFEHSIADIFYFFAARSFDLPSILFLLVVVLGNTAGGILFRELHRLYNYLAEKDA
ncbi:MAG: formate/nitrite transporter family protein [Clostridia bacterium]|nr:formate/nitrite transporter family protein [Clostridia bacterium]